MPALANRLSVRTSVQRAVDTLDAFTLRVLEALVVTAEGGRSASTVRAADLLRLPGRDELNRAVDELGALGLIWGAPPAVRLVAGARESVGAHPAGLGRPAAALFRGLSDAAIAPVLRALKLPPSSQPGAGEAVAAILADPERVRRLIEDCDADERAIVDRLAAGPPIGTVRSAQALAAREDAPPAHRLMARGLLVALDANTVELPREIALALREQPVGHVQPRPPQIRVVARPPAELDSAGGTAVLEALRLVESLGEHWTAHPPSQLRSGGVGVRDLRRTARELGVDEPVVAVIAETAAAAGLFNATHELESAYLPTAEFDTWLEQPPARRWTQLATAWLAMSRHPGLVNQRGDRDRVISLLGPDVERGTIAAARRQVLDALATLSPGSAPRERGDVLAYLAWQAPRRANGQGPLAESILIEADLLGVTAAGGLTGYSRTLLDGSRTVAEQVLTDALPEPVAHFLVQPDLTIVVPGPPTAELARELALVADLESTGGASVYRLTETTVRRALDAGRGASQLHAFMAASSRTPLPQALTYLIDDAARRHGALRTGVASAYLRCDDHALLTRVVSDRATNVLQLRQIAPSVAVCSAPVARVLEVLREAGYAPAAEAADGEIIALDGEPARAPSRPPAHPARARTGLSSAAQLAEVVRKIRAGDTLSTISTRVQPISQQVPGVTSAATMGALRGAIRSGRHVLINCAEPDGTATRHTIVPISMAGGFVRGHEPTSRRLQSFPLHRLIAVSVLDDYTDSDDAS